MVLGAAGITLFGLLGLLAAYLSYKKYYIVRDTPVSNIQSLAAGFVQIKGEFKKKDKLSVNPYNNEECIYYDFKIQERSTDSDGNKEWDTIDSKVSKNDFIVDDGTGQITVKSKGSTFKISDKTSVKEVKSIGSKEEAPDYLKEHFDESLLNIISDDEFRIISEWIKEGDTGYVLGNAKLKEDSNSKVNEENLYIAKGDTRTSYFGKPFVVSNMDKESTMMSSYKRDTIIWLVIGLGCFLSGLYFTLAELSLA